MHWISKSYGIKIPPIGRSFCHCPPCLEMWSRGGVGGVLSDEVGGIGWI